MLSPTWSQNNEQSNKGPWLLLAYETYLLKNFDFPATEFPVSTVLTQTFPV